MDFIQFKINGKPYVVGKNVDCNLTLLDFIRGKANLFGTKFMCLEAGCGACIVSVIKNPRASPIAINACMVIILSCHNWEITTIEKVGNRLDGYHRIQKTLAEYNGTQCGHCSPGWVMSMYSLLQSTKDLSMLEIEKSFSSNVCRCTGYRSILDAFKSFAKDAPKSQDIINDIEDLHICKKKGSICDKNSCSQDDDNDWCIVTNYDLESPYVIEIILKDGKYWYKVQQIKDIFEILKTKGDDSYMLVFGNTAKGAYPIIECPRVLIDISDVGELKGFKIDQNLIIGAGNTLTELLLIFEKLSLAENYFGYLKVLYEHLTIVASTSVRNLGSIGGNLMIKYQHNEFPSDLFLLFVTVGAQLTIVEAANVQQVVTMEQFLKVNMRGKIIRNVLMPPLNEDYKVVTYKIMPKAQNAHAIVNAGFLYKYKGSSDKVLQCRIAYGGLSASFVRATLTEKILIGKVLFYNDTLRTALGVLEAEIVAEENPPEPSKYYRKQLSLALFYKSLLFLSPSTNLAPQYRSGALNLNASRPLSSGQHRYDTKPSLYPLTQPIPKIEARIQCAGEASYTDDRRGYSEELFAALVLSTVPTGKILSIDPSRALSQPGAVAFYCAKDIPGLNSFTPVEDPFGRKNEEVFSSGEIKYFNQPIGVVAAETKYIAEKIAKMVDVKYYNVKKPVIDVKVAKNEPNRNSVFAKIDATDKGIDIQKTLKGTISGYGQCHFTLETIAVISRPTEEGLEIFATSQWIDALQTMVSRALNIEQNRIDVYVRRIGGGFGLKISRTTLSAVACSLVTFKLNKSCRINMPLTDVTQAFGKRFPFSADYELATDKKGLIQYLNLNLYEDNGFDVNELLQMLAVADYNNCYDGSRWNYTNISTITDTAKNTWIRAPGHLESIAVVEGIMERISYELSLDPVDVRIANLEKSTSLDVLEIIKTLTENSQYYERKVEVSKFNEINRWKKRGLGTCIMRWMQNYPRNFDVILSVFHGDGSIIITHGGIEMGQGINTKAIQICAYLLKVPLDKIQVKANSTIIAPNAAVSGGSLTTQYMTMGVQKCCKELLRRLAPVKAKMGNLSWAELIQKAFEMNVDLQIHEYVGTNYTQDYYLFGMTIAEVEVDILTGERQVLRVDILEDVGQSPSPEIDLGQIEGAFVQGMGHWLSEQLVYDGNSGELLTNRTWNYYVPQALDIPQDFRIYFRKNSYSTDILFGSKFVGEPPICMAIAVPHAIRQALTSARFDSGIPTTCWFNIDDTYTLENVFLAGGTKSTDFKLN